MNTVRRSAVGVVSLTALLAGAAPSRAQLQVPRAQRPAPNGVAETVKYAVRLSKDTVTVGEPFAIRVRVRAPAGAEIRFPENPDTSGMVQARDPRVISVTDSVQSHDVTATYRLAAWDVGTQPVVLGDVTVTWEGTDARERRTLPIGGVEVFVRSVLPADSTLRVPRPARPLWEPRVFPWWLLGAVLVTIAFGLLLWWWWRRRRRPAAPLIVDPYDRARREFNRIEAMGLVDAGERTRYAALVVEVLRDYLAARYTEAPLSATSRELLVSLRRRPAVPNEQLARVLHEADLAKFAGWTLSEPQARALGADARVIVEREREATQPQPEPKAA